MSSKPSTNADVLRRIASRAQEFTKFLSTKTILCLPSSQSAPQSAPEPLPDDLVLPTPRPLTTDLITMGLDSVTAERFSSAYMRTAMRSKATNEVHLRRAYAAYYQVDQCGTFDNARFLSALRTAYISTYTKNLQAWAHKIVADYVPRVLRVRQAQNGDLKASSNGRKQRRRPFNHNAIPILEEFFARNRRPSRTEKHDLASTTGMEYKQINVWFQNRRNRSKKDNLGGGAEGFPAELETCAAEILYEEEHPSDDNPVTEGSESKTILLMATDGGVCAGFNLERPAHAFPSSYPPSCPYNPFPIQEDVRSFLTPWLRKCSVSCRASDTATDVTRIIGIFAELSITETVPAESQRELGTSKITPISSENTTSLLGFTTVVPHAPLYALLPAAVISPPKALPPVSQESVVLTDFQPASETAGLVSPPEAITCMAETKAVFKRKVATLPRRVPAGATRLGYSFVASKDSSSLFRSSNFTSSASTSSRSSLESSVSPSSKVDPCIWTQLEVQPSVTSERMPSSSAAVLPLATITSSSSATHLPSHISRDSASRRKSTGLPKRIPITKDASIHMLPSTPTESSPTPFSRKVSTLSRMSSISSISSTTSFGSSSPSSSESEGPLTPPSTHANLPSSKLLTSPFTPGLELNRNGAFAEFSTDDFSPIEGLQLDLSNVGNGREFRLWPTNSRCC